MIQEIYTPKRTATAGAASNWHSSDNSVDYYIQRKDREFSGFTFVSIVTKGNIQGARILINLTSPIVGISPGKDIYINFLYKDEFDGVYELEAITSSTIMQVWIPGLTSAFTTVPGYIVFSGYYPDYHLKVDLYSQQNGVNITRITNTMFATSDETGKIRINVSELLQPQLTMDDSYNYDGVNKQDFGRDFKYRIRAEERFSYPGTGYAAIFFEPFWVVKSAKQLGDLYGQNMREYMTYPFSTGNETKFMNTHTPTYFVGFPFCLSFIYSDRTANFRLNRHVEQLDVNQNTIASTDSDFLLDSSYKDHVNRLSLNGMDAIQSNCRYLHVWLDETDEALESGVGGGSGTGTGTGGGDASYVEEDYYSS